MFFSSLEHLYIGLIYKHMTRNFMAFVLPTLCCTLDKICKNDTEKLFKRNLRGFHPNIDLKSKSTCF